LESEESEVPNVDLVIDQGSDFRRLLKIKNPEGVALDISDRTFTAIVKENYSKKKFLTWIELEKTDQELSPGELHLFISSERTRSLRITDPTIYFYDIKQFFGGEETILISGKIIIQPRATV